MRALPSVALSAWLLLGFVARADDLPRAKPQDAGFSTEKLAKVKSAVQDMVDKKQSAGAVVGVIRRGKVVMLEAVGDRDAASGEPMRTDSIFRIYSMTKPLTTTAAMILYEEGKLGLDDPVSKYLPEFKDLRVSTGKGDETEPAKREVTVRDLMRHTSGLTYGAFSDTPVDRLYRENRVGNPGDDLAEMVRKLGKLPLLYQPGTRFHYSYSTDVLGRVVEVASGRPFDEFLRDRIFKPLDMRDTGFFVPEEKLNRFTTCYGPGKDGGLKVTDPAAKSPFRTNPKYHSGGGGLVSTARDYLRFCQMMLNGGGLDGARVLKQETVRMMTSNQLPPEAPPMEVAGNKMPGMGFGLGFSVQLNEGPSQGEYGWGGAASTHFWISPKQELAVVAMQQYMPMSPRLLMTVKPIIAAALEK